MCDALTYVAVLLTTFPELEVFFYLLGWHWSVWADLLMAIKILKNYKKNEQVTFMFYLLYICDLHNQREELKLKNSGYK